VSSVTFEWGHLLILIRHDRRALHDILAGTRVVRRMKKAIRMDPEPESESAPISEDEPDSDNDPNNE
jgi:hypothetical protein